MQSQNGGVDLLHIHPAEHPHDMPHLHRGKDPHNQQQRQHSAGEAGLQLHPKEHGAFLGSFFFFDLFIHGKYPPDAAAIGAM